MTDKKTDEQKKDPTVSVKDALAELWEQGIVCEWLLDDVQKEIRHLYKTTKAKQIVAVIGRQQGKSWCSLTIAIEECINKKRFKVTFVAPTQKQARMIVKQTAREILDTCPPELRPTLKTQENTFVFPNESEIEILGNNAGRIESARGGKSNLIICDEVGFWDDLEYSVKSVLMPRLNTTKGKLLMISTPPKSAGHPFQKFYETAKYRKASILRNVYTCPRFTKEAIDEFAEEQGGYDSVSFKREYECQFLTDLSMAVIPEATEEKMKAIVQDWERPPFMDTYTCMDLGLKDLTFILFAYFDFRRGKVVIEDELVINNPEELRTDKLAYAIYDKEQELWFDPTMGYEAYKPYLRISDVDHFVINDLYLQHGMEFMPTSKDDQDIMVNNLRMMISNEKIVINPRCKELIFHLQNAVWKDSKKKVMDRSPDAGHYDGVDALKYLVRNIHFSKNPYPATYDLNLNSNSFLSPHWKEETSSFKEGLKEMYAPKTRKKR